MSPASPDTSLPRIPRDRGDDYTEDAVRRRRELCEGVRGGPLDHLAGKPVPPAEARGNIENLIGFAQVPVGIAGPLRVRTSAGWREVYVPMATTEGTMVASYSRGMSVLREGGVSARVVDHGLSQHPVLVYGSFEEAARAQARALSDASRYRSIVEGLSRHGRLSAVEPELLGRRLLLRLVFTTGDAIGINMAAKAADVLSADLASATGARERYVHGQDVEKRANARALVEGRGRNTIAEAVIPRQLVEEKLRTTVDELIAIQRTYALGYAQLGTQNGLIQAANGLAAVMVACGQDVAYVTESSTGHLDFAAEGEDLYVSVHLPNMIVGTVGGGSMQGTARECLELLGCAGDGGADTFSEILAATVLAGDLSLMAAFTSHEFVAAHENLGRNRPQ